MADHPLRPATDRRLGEPLPHQLANRARAPLGTAAFKNRPPFLARPEGLASVCGISSGFPKLFPTPRQVTHVLLTRSPLYSRPEGHFRARLACIRHAASVHSEPGSNSPVESCMRSGSVAEPRTPGAVTSALVASGNSLAPGVLVVDVQPGGVTTKPRHRRGVVSLSDVIFDGRRGRRGIDADYFLYSVFKEPAIRGRGATWAQARRLRRFATCPRPALDGAPQGTARGSAERRRGC